MTLEEFTNLRRDELVAFFKARFGRHWRQIVVRQAGEHRRAFDRWRSAPAGSLYRQIYRLDKWARSIGFESALDERVQARLREYQAFQKAAARAVADEQAKRSERARADGDLDVHQIDQMIAEGLRRLREASPEKRGR